MYIAENDIFTIFAPSYIERCGKRATLVATKEKA